MSGISNDPDVVKAVYIYSAALVAARVSIPSALATLQACMTIVEGIEAQRRQSLPGSPFTPRLVPPQSSFAPHVKLEQTPSCAPHVKLEQQFEQQFEQAPHLKLDFPPHLKFEQQFEQAQHHYAQPQQQPLYFAQQFEQGPHHYAQPQQFEQAPYAQPQQLFVPMLQHPHPGNIDASLVAEGDALPLVAEENTAWGPPERTSRSRSRSPVTRQSRDRVDARRPCDADGEARRRHRSEDAPRDGRSWPIENGVHVLAPSFLKQMTIQKATECALTKFSSRSRVVKDIFMDHYYRGYFFVTMASAEDAAAVITEFTGTTWMQERMSLHPRVPPRGHRRA